MFSFVIAGFICVTIHDYFIGPIAYGPNNAMHQVAKKYNKKTVMQKPSKVRALALKR